VRRRPRRWIRRLIFQDIRREAVSWLLALVSLALSVLYAIPGLGFAVTIPSGRTSVVAFLDPAWTFAFGAAGLGLAAGLMSGRCLVAAHTFGVAVFSFWSAAVLIGAVMSDPAGPVIAAVLGAAVTVLHFWSVVDYAGG
jgi:hypothetical protein